MQVGTICTRDVITIDAQSPLADAANLMRERHVGSLVVTCRGARGVEVCGMVTDRDMVLDAMAREAPVVSLRIGDLASTDLTLILDSADLDEAITVMQVSGVRRLLVTNGEEQLCGLLSIDDVMQALARQMDGLAQIMTRGREREMGEHPVTPEGSRIRFPPVGTAAWTQGAP